MRDPQGAAWGLVFAAFSFLVGEVQDCELFSVLFCSFVVCFCGVYFFFEASEMGFLSVDVHSGDPFCNLLFVAYAPVLRGSALSFGAVP